MKRGLKYFIARLLGAQVRRLVRKRKPKVIAVVGSIGKTSTKLAIANVLTRQYKVAYQTGNYNDLVSVPLIFFGRTMPNLINPFAWLWLLCKNELSLLRKYPYEFVVVELGTDGPGQIFEFSSYLKPDLTIITAIAPEHMEYFADMAEVAHEELMVASFSNNLLINKDLIDAQYLKGMSSIPEYYSIKQPANYELKNIKFDADEANFDFYAKGEKIISSKRQHLSEPQLYSVLAAAAVGQIYDMQPGLIDEGIRALPQVSGRMQILAGIDGSTIIDDSYNASPEATKAALDTLYRIETKHRIALLGSMNELGKYSKQEHEAIGAYCDPKKLSLVVTLGPDANKYLAKAAADTGCKVVSFEDPISAGEFLAKDIQPGTTILVKGSQNKVFAEEAIKRLLAKPSDAKKLVRQSADWMEIKQRCFPSVRIK